MPQIHGLAGNQAAGKTRSAGERALRYGVPLAPLQYAASVLAAATMSAGCGSTTSSCAGW
jgi:hypothetical protein